jgi:hypothetical protein
MIAPSPGFMGMASPMMMTTVGSPMTNTNTTTQLTAPSPMGIPTASPGNIYGKFIFFLIFINLNIY